MCSIYPFWSSQRGLHHGCFKYSVWVHLLIVWNTSLFFEWNLTKLSKKHVHNLKNMTTWYNLWNIYSWPPFRNIDLLITVKIGCSDLVNMTLWFFSRMSNLVVNTWVDSVMSPLPLFTLQILLDIQIFKFSLFCDLVLKLTKPDIPISQTGQSSFFSFFKFCHQHTPPWLLVKLMY
jgi:hypothetical protein